MTAAENKAVHVSGEQIKRFSAGWAKDIFSNSSIGHYYERDGFADAKSLCGERGDIRWLFGIGTYSKCKRCLKRARQ